jgi:hypothetical protein
MYLQNVSIQSQAVCDGIIDRETAILGQLQCWTWIKRLIKAQNAALNPQVRLLMEPNLINSSHIGWKVLRQERCGKIWKHHEPQSCNWSEPEHETCSANIWRSDWWEGSCRALTHHGPSWIWFAWGRRQRSSPEDLEQGQNRRTMKDRVCSNLVGASCQALSKVIYDFLNCPLADH